MTVNLTFQIETGYENWEPMKTQDSSWYKNLYF